jgi:DNA-binding GntR family transcriptional regulator
VNLPLAASRASAPSPLQVELAERIARLIHEDEVEPGSRLNEKRLAEQLGVSRTPVRAALEHLAAGGFVQRQQNRGVELLKRPPLPDSEPDAASGDELLTRIAADRHGQRLADTVSEQELMQAYGLPRAAIKEALTRLADLGVVERKLGHGWKFVERADAQVRHESYRFRLVMEPASLLEPDFAIDPAWAAQSRERHEAFLTRRWTKASSVAFFEMNADFHEGLARGSNNRFFFEALRRLNRLRRLSNYDWRHGRDRVTVSVIEHMKILDFIEAGEMGQAALLMRQHLELAQRIAR